MKKIAWVGSPFFQSAMAGFGWEVAFINFEDTRVLRWGDIVERAGFEPDVVVVADKSRPPFVLGVENFPCVTVLYCVDTHIHSWLPIYAQAFDLCLVSLKDHVPDFQGLRLADDRIFWCPAFAWQDARPDWSAEKEWDLLFVGNVDPVTMPGRARFLDRLKERCPELEIRRGNYRRLYPRAKAVLNYAENGDLNFRAFEAPACGVCLMQPRVGHGLSDFFTDGEDLLTYPQTGADASDAEIDAAISELLEKFTAILADPVRLDAVSRSGWRKVEENHRPVHRAELLDRILGGLDASIPFGKDRHLGKVTRRGLKTLYLHHAQSTPALAGEYLEAARAM